MYGIKKFNFERHLHDDESHLEKALNFKAECSWHTWKTVYYFFPTPLWLTIKLILFVQGEKKHYPHFPEKKGKENFATLSHQLHFPMDETLILKMQQHQVNPNQTKRKTKVGIKGCQQK